MFFSNTNRTNRTNLLGCDPVYIRGIREIRGQDQPQAATLANPSEIPMHRKKQRSKKIRVKDSVCIGAIREFFFDLRSVAAGSQNEL